MMKINKGRNKKKSNGFQEAKRRAKRIYWNGAVFD